MKFKLNTYRFEVEMFWWLDQLRPNNNYRMIIENTNHFLVINNELDAFLFKMKWSEIINDMEIR